MKSAKTILIALTTCIVLCLEFGIMFFDIPLQKIISCTNPESTYYAANVYEQGVLYQRFHNYVDGYNLLIEGEWNIDMNQCDIATVLTNNTTRIEIYKEYTPTADKQAEYMGYSNGFTDNETDHHVSVKEIRSYGSNYAMTTIWDRKKSTVASTDYNHYATFDLCIEDYTYSIFIKSTEEINPRFYEIMIASFQTERITKSFTPSKTSAIDMEERKWNKETKEFYQKYFSDNDTLTWGIFEPEFACFNVDNYRRIENAIDYEFPIMVWYNHITKEPDITYWNKLLNESYNNGKILELTLQTVDANNDEGAMVYEILRGEYDNYLKAYAKTISDFDHPVLFRLGNEMNGDWCSYSGYQLSKDPQVYIQFYRYVYHLFEEAGADNVIWIWNPNGESKPPFRWNHAMMYYPGDTYVDIVGLTAYNTGTYYAEIGEKWKTFTELYDTLYEEYDARFGQPLMITEFASASTGGDKAQWIQDMFRDIKNYPRIKVAIWWDGCDYDYSKEKLTVARSYIIDESDEILEIFRKNLKNQ